MCIFGCMVYKVFDNLGSGPNIEWEVDNAGKH